jgi:hypothetical protein
MHPANRITRAQRDGTNRGVAVLSISIWPEPPRLNRQSLNQAFLASFRRILNRESCFSSPSPSPILPARLPAVAASNFFVCLPPTTTDVVVAVAAAAIVEFTFPAENSTF